MIIDLRSDTVTKPSGEMLQAMFSADVGDDVFGEDPSVNELERFAADLFGHEAALFCPSGTMTNQIAVRINTEPQDEVICDKRSHVYNYESGGLAYNSMVSVMPLDGDRGRLTPEMIEENIRPETDYYPRSGLVVIENTVNKGGGSFYTIEQVKEIRELCLSKKLLMHLDGARLFNALVETREDPKEWGNLFDTLSICLSKGLGTPAGSILISDHEKIKKARRVRKVLGGGMRQVGYLAAAGLFALKNNINRLKEDHRRAGQIAEILASNSLVQDILPVDTNIVICQTKREHSSGDVVRRFQELDILVVPFGPNEIRLVTHLDFNDEMLELFDQRMKKIDP
jgi:threonine aldolase